jgi:hypothetical protein
MDLRQLIVRPGDLVSAQGTLTKVKQDIFISFVGAANFKAALGTNSSWSVAVDRSFSELIVDTHV